VLERELAQRPKSRLPCYYFSQSTFSPSKALTSILQARILLSSLRRTRRPPQNQTQQITPSPHSPRPLCLEIPSRILWEFLGFCAFYANFIHSEHTFQRAWASFPCLPRSECDKWDGEITFFSWRNFGRWWIRRILVRGGGFWNSWIVLEFFRRFSWCGESEEFFSSPSQSE
jgi:hypothetical protein